MVTPRLERGSGSQVRSEHPNLIKLSRCNQHSFRTLLSSIPLDLPTGSLAAGPHSEPLRPPSYAECCYQRGHREWAHVVAGALAPGWPGSSRAEHHACLHHHRWWRSKSRRPVPVQRPGRPPAAPQTRGRFRRQWRRRRRRVWRLLGWSRASRWRGVT